MPPHSSSLGTPDEGKTKLAIKFKYRSSTSLKTVLFVIAVLIAGSLLYYTQLLISELRNETREFATFYAEMYARVATEEDVQDFSFLFDRVIRAGNFPIIISDTSGVPTDWKNLDLENDNRDPETIVRVTEIMQRMDAQSEPIELSYTDAATGRKYVLSILHYGDSSLITSLRWLPIVEIAAGAIFVLVGLAGFQFIRRSERHLIWVGMAKETAHQLGTPLSSLMGWTEILREADQDKVKNILPEMLGDLNRLSKVAQRFSQIGSGGSIEEHNLNDLIMTVVEYLRKRLPQKGKQIKIITKLNELPDIRVNKDLFEWALENLLKNSADAIEKEDGRIEIDSKYSAAQSIVSIKVKDNGKGVHPRNRKDIFMPGYSTRKGGWGLGLSLTKRIIEDYHKGKLLLVDSVVGEGTVMELQFPAPNMEQKSSS